MDDLSDEGFGLFRETWLIRDVTVREAEDVIAEEAALAALADRFATDDDEFDQLANALEAGDRYELSGRLAETPAVGGDELYDAAQRTRLRTGPEFHFIGDRAPQDRCVGAAVQIDWGRAASADLWCQQLKRLLRSVVCSL